MFDGSTAVIHENRIARHTAHPETFLATLQINGPSRNVRGFLSIDNRMLQEPEIDTYLQNALRDYCAKTVPPDDFLLCARPTGKKHGIEFIEMRTLQMIC